MTTEKPAKKRKPKAATATASADTAPAPAVTAEAAQPSTAETLLRLPDSLQIKDVEACRQQLLASLSGGRPQCLDLSALAAIDTAGVQLLVAFRAEARKSGLPLRFRGESRALIEAVQALGLEWGPAT